MDGIVANMSVEYNHYEIIIKREATKANQDSYNYFHYCTSSTKDIIQQLSLPHLVNVLTITIKGLHIYNTPKQLLLDSILDSLLSRELPVVISPVHS